MQSERDTNLLLLERTICYAVVLPIAVPQKEKKLTIGSRDLELEISEVMPHWKKKKRFLDQIMVENFKKIEDSRNSNSAVQKNRLN